MATALTRILLVDDEPDIREVVSLALETIGGFTVEMAKSGREALEMVRQWNPQLILLDVMMPGLDGPGTLGRLKEDPATADIPVVFMTAKAQPQELARFVELGALDVIVKPLDPMTLSERVRSLWEHRND
ncbi:MAG: response regulator [Nitrospirota bacterium]|nr:response regulator [Nitrospirota bacterium]